MGLDRPFVVCNSACRPDIQNLDRGLGSRVVRLVVRVKPGWWAGSTASNGEVRSMRKEVSPRMHRQREANADHRVYMPRIEAVLEWETPIYNDRPALDNAPRVMGRATA